MVGDFWGRTVADTFPRPEVRMAAAGIDVFNFPLDEQLNTHRNRYNNIITTWRWVCMSRTDRDWCESGYASQASKDRATGNKLLVDCYRLRGEVESE